MGFKNLLEFPVFILKMDYIASSPTYTGTQVNYYFVCHRKLWLFSHGLDMEHTSDTVYMGKLVHEESYARQRKEVVIDERIVIDFAEREGVIHEIKKSRAVEQAHIWQVLYYLYYLKLKGVAPVVGEINYPLLRRKERVALTPELEQQLQDALTGIEAIIGQPQAPPLKEKRSFCKKCSYEELCWG